MLILRRHDSGFSLIELMIVVALIALLMTIAVPAFGTWSANARVRAAAESMVAALRQTEAMAAARSRVSVFALTTATPTYNATASASGTNWFAVLVPLAGSDETAANLGTLLTGTTAGQYGVTIAMLNTASGAAGTGALCFNPLGQVVDPTTATGVGQSCDGTAQTYQIRKTGATSKFNLTVGLGGQVRMCDFNKTLSNTNPDGC